MTWSATDAGSGIKNYTVQVSANGGTYATIAARRRRRGPSWTARSPTASSYRFRVRAVDREGNISAWRYSLDLQAGTLPGVHVPRDLRRDVGPLQDRSARSVGRLGRPPRSAGRPRSRPRAYDIGLVWTRTTTSGSADIYVDGVFASRVGLRATSTLYRQLVFTRHWRRSPATPSRSARSAPAGSTRRVRGPALTLTTGCERVAGWRPHARSCYTTAALTGRP